MKNKEELVGRYIRGFKFKDRDRCSFPKSMYECIGKIGVIKEYLRYNNSYRVNINNTFWYYPAELIEEHLIDTPDKEESQGILKYLPMKKEGFEPQVKDKVVESVVNKYTSRSNTGVEKYGVTLEREDLSVEDWLIHLQEELMDATNYIEVLIGKIRQLKEFKL